MPHLHYAVHSSVALPISVKPLSQEKDVQSAETPNSGAGIDTSSSTQKMRYSYDARHPPFGWASSCRWLIV